MFVLTRTQSFPNFQSLIKVLLVFTFCSDACVSVAVENEYENEDYANVIPIKAMEKLEDAGRVEEEESNEDDYEEMGPAEKVCFSLGQQRPEGIYDVNDDIYENI